MKVASASDSLKALTSNDLDLPDPNPELDLARLSTSGSDPYEAARAVLQNAQALYRQGQLDQAALSAEAAWRDLALLTHREDADYTLTVLEATMLLGRIAHAAGQFGDAAAYFETALQQARELSNAPYETDLLNLQAGVLGDQGDYPEALQLLGEALALTRKLDLAERQGTVLSNMGTLYTLLGDFPRALEHLTAAYALLQQTSPGSRAETMNLLSLGGLYEELNHQDEARLFFTRAREAGRAAHDPLIEAAALNNLANGSLKCCDYVAAQALFNEALELARQVGMRQYEIDNLDGLGEVYIACGDVVEAFQTHLQALEIARDIRDPEGEIDALLNLGRDHLQLGEPAQALPLLHDSLALAQSVGRQPSVFCAHERLAEAYEVLGEPGAALLHYRAFHEAEKIVYNAESERRTQQLSVQFELERIRADAAAERLRSDLLRLARDEAEKTVRSRTHELEEAQLEIVTRLAVAAEYRDDSTGEHTKRVGRNAAALAYALGWPETEVQLLFIAARLHDVGKLAVPDAILHKSGRLEPDEYKLVQAHTEIGARILSAGNTRLLQLAEEVALAHHERYDGLGYPSGLAGEAIPLAARIVAVADVLDALTHRRPYKAAWSVADALAEIRRESGLQFDPAVVRACLLVFGPDRHLSPLEASHDWPSTLLGLRRERPGEHDAEHQVLGDEHP